MEEEVVVVVLVVAAAVVVVEMAVEALTAESSLQPRDPPYLKPSTFTVISLQNLLSPLVSTPFCSLLASASVVRLVAEWLNISLSEG